MQLLFIGFYTYFFEVLGYCMPIQLKHIFLVQIVLEHVYLFLCKCDISYLIDRHNLSRFVVMSLSKIYDLSITY